MECIFCKIVAGAVSCQKVYENDHVLAFLTIAPVMPNHTLVIPKSHVTNILDCPSETLNEIMSVVQMLAKKFIRDGHKAVKIIQNNNAPLQEVLHLHFHVIPY